MKKVHGDVMSNDKPSSTWYTSASRRLGRLPCICTENPVQEGYRIFPVVHFARAEYLAAGRKQKQIKMAASSAVSKGKKRGRDEPGRVEVYKWVHEFLVIPVGTEKEEYV